MFLIKLILEIKNDNIRDKNSKRIREIWLKLCEKTKQPKSRTDFRISYFCVSLIELALFISFSDASAKMLGTKGTAISNNSGISSHINPAAELAISMDKDTVFKMAVKITKAMPIARLMRHFIPLPQRKSETKNEMKAEHDVKSTILLNICVNSDDSKSSFVTYK